MGYAMPYLAQGIHPNIDAEQYHLDALTPEPALSASGIKMLLSGSPADFAARSVRLSQWPDFARRTATRSQDLGSVAHSKILNTPCEYHAIRPQDLALPPYNIVLKSGKRKGQPYTTWSGDAKVWKEEQEAAGVMVLDPSDHASIMSAVGSMERLLRAEYGDWPIGPTEQTVIWQRETEHGPIWCRARIDVLALRFMAILDPKFTETGIGNFALDKKVKGERFDIQALWYLSGLGSAGVPGAFAFRFSVAELTPPFQSRWVEVDDWMQTAEADIEWACNLFAKCLRSGEWPEYGDDVYRPACPSYLQIAAEERRIR